MKSENSKGPWVDPCGTPHLINCVEDMSSPICTYCKRKVLFYNVLNILYLVFNGAKARCATSRFA